VATTDATDFDLLVIGGGINGAGIARDAAGRGLRVCLVEADDLAAHTSSASSKLIHGGLRYLEYGELRLVREALAERERLLAIAPHIVHPLRFVLPYVDGLRPRWLLRLGLFVYDHVGARERLAATDTLELDGTALGAPLLPSIRHGFGYSDCWVEDSRLVVLNAMDAAERGATVLTQWRVSSARDDGGIWRVQCRGRGDPDVRLLTARALVNASGAWVNDVLRLAGVEPRQHLRLVKGSHLVLRRLYEGDHAYLLQRPDRRVVFAIPFEREFTLVGTTDVPFSGDPSSVQISATEQEYLLSCLHSFFRRKAMADDIVGTFSGVRALFDDGSEAAQRVSRDYQLELQTGASGSPILSVYGGKITTYRRLAEAALQRLLPALGKDGGEGWTASEALPGGDMPDGDLASFTGHTQQRWPGLPRELLGRLARTYGTRLARIIGDAQDMHDLGRDYGGGLTAAEVAYLVRYEWACSAADILERRTRLAYRFPVSGVHDLQDAVSQLLR
jgi:glycerol-3-phosphate dehydrogenase